MTVRIEVTDLYAGEANYSWRNEYTLDVPNNISHVALMRRVKNKLGWNGVRCSVKNYGGLIDIRPRNFLHVAFVTFE